MPPRFQACRHGNERHVVVLRSTLDACSCQTSSMVMNSREQYPPLLSLAVHEFRTPASVVGGYLRMLQRDGDGLSDRHRKMIDEAEKSCTRLVGLIAELSDI